MYLSLWFGVVLAGGQTGCSKVKNEPTPPPMVQNVRPAAPAPQNPGGGMRNPDYNQIPKVPPPGARVTYNGVNISEPYIALTFDDGPHPTFTPRLLDILKARNVKATFYVLGQNARNYPHIIRRMLAEGHEIGNHTWNHPSLTSVSESSARDQMNRTAQTITSLTGYHMRTMRPPYGATNQHIKNWMYSDYGYPTILWTVDPLDWKRPGASVVTSRIVAGTRPGAIILAHDIHAGTIDAMPATIDTLLSKGYRFVTVCQLLNMEQRPLAGGPAPAPRPLPAGPGVLQPAAFPAPGPSVPFQPLQPVQTIRPAIPSEAPPGAARPPGI